MLHIGGYVLYYIPLQTIFTGIGIVMCCIPVVDLPTKSRSKVRMRKGRRRTINIKIQKHQQCIHRKHGIFLDDV